MRRTVWVILLGGLVLAVVMQARTVVERRHFDEDMPATIQSETRALKVRGIPGGGSVTIADATPEIARKSKSSSSRKRNPPLPERDEIVWTKTVESDKLPKSAAYEDALDRARNALTHEFNLSLPPSRDFINKRVKVDYTEKDDKVARSGIIAVQIHGGGPSEAWYKDITITELKTAK